MTLTNRFFAFGCSFTKYAWPTWADLIAAQYPNYYNYGTPGAGNMYIFNAVMEADQKHTLSKDDLVIVQWSGPSREDRYIKNKWVTPGSIAHYYSEDYINRYFDFRGFLIRDLAAIKATKALLDKIGCNYRFIAMVPLSTNNEYTSIFDPEVVDVCEFYKDVIEAILPSYLDVLGPYGHSRPTMLGDIKVVDNHPLPLEHFKYVKTVLPEFNIDQQVAENYNHILESIWNTHNCGWSYEWIQVRKTQPIKRL